MNRRRICYAREIAARVAMCCALVLAARGASAAGEEPLRIDYHAGASCPSEDAFLTAVRARTERWRQAIGPEASRRFVVEVASRGATVHGRLALTDRAGALANREVDGATCEVVVEALALMTALAIDPQASLAPVPQRPPPPAPLLPAPPVRAIAAPEPALAPPVLWHFALGAHEDATSGETPDLMFGGNVFLEASVHRDSILAPSARLMVKLSKSSPFPTSAGTAHFSRLLGGVEVCPLRLDVRGGVLAFVPCGVFDAGTLHAAGSDTARARAESRIWLDAGAAARIEWVLTRRVALEVEGGALFPVTRDHFRFPTLPVYDVPAVGGYASIGVAMRFW